MLDQDFVAPASCHMPAEGVSVSVREHRHDERTPEGVVSWTELVGTECMKKFGGGRSGTVQLSMRDRDEEMSRQNRKECNQLFRTEARIVSVF